jgi:hypothetical protein
MDEKEVSSGGHGSDGNELEDNKKKAKKAPKGGAQSLNASPRRGFSPRFGPPPENHHLHHQAKKKKKGKKGRDGDDDGDETIHLEEEGGSRVRDRSKTLDYSTMSEVSSRLQEKEKKEKKNKGATATREGRSATTFEAPAPSTKLNSSKSKRSTSVRNALTCFIPSSAKESPATDETMIDKKKMGDMITLAAEAEDDDGGSGKRKKKKAGKSGSTSTSTSSSSSSLPSSPSRAPTVHHHRLSGGMAFGDGQRSATTKKHRRNLSALEDLQYNNVVVVAANKGTAAPPLTIPTSSSSPTLDSRPSKVRIPACLSVSAPDCCVR